MNEQTNALSLLQLDPETINQLARLIQAGRCALVLGPHCTNTTLKGQQAPLRAALAHELAEYLLRGNVLQRLFQLILGLESRYVLHLLE